MTTPIAAGPLDRRVGDDWLTECPNPAHIFTCGRWLFAWQMAGDFWAAKEKPDMRVRHLLSIAIVKHDELTLARLIVHRLSAWIGRVPNDRVEGRDAALSRRVPSHDGLAGSRYEDRHNKGAET